MKIKIFKLSALLLSAAAITACVEEEGGGLGNYKVPAIFGFQDKTYVSLPMVNEVCDLTVLKSGEVGSSVELSGSEEALETYNIDNGTEYLAVPDNLYEISPKTLTFSETETGKPVKVTWKGGDISALGSEKDYVIAIQLKADEPSHVSKVKGYIIIHPAWSTISMASTGASAVQPRMDRVADTFEARVNVSIAMETDVTVNFEIDNSLVEAYNKEKGTQYAVAPEGFITLGTGSTVIPAGQMSAAFSYAANSQAFFTGNILNDYDANGYLVPVRIKSTSSDLLAIRNEITYIPVSMATKQIKGPWTVLEGQNLCYANQPGGRPGWAGGYTTDRLFDGNTTTDWISWWFDSGESTQEQDIPFPMVFVVDMGSPHVFTKFRIAGTNLHHKNYRKFEMYTAETYDGASTVWTLAANGLCGDPGSDGISDYPPASGEFHMPVGRYLKFVIVEAQLMTGDCIWGRGKLYDVFGIGF